VDPGARLVDNRAKGALISELASLVAISRDGAGIAGPMPTISGVELAGVVDDRARVDRTRAFVKVQDGCSFHCTYCIIPTARGPERSLPPEDVLADVGRALAAGHREIVLTGINIGTYDGGWSERGFRGSHSRAALDLAGLVRRILDETAVDRLRLSSIEPQHVDDELLETWQRGAPRTLPHLHLPLQSGDDRILRRMGRRYGAEEYARIVDRARSGIPGLAVYADVIVGFPGEDDATFDRSLGFIRSLGLAGIHVFRYSARPGTPAVRMVGQVDEPTKKRRAGLVLDVAREARRSAAQATVGGERQVLFESRLPDGRWVGRSEDYVACAVDGTADGRSLENAIGRVRLTGTDPGDPERASGELVAVDRPHRIPLTVIGGHDAA
jgi:threonylcarbamoyladenosine tRNA methylthiotransferase MtaB